MVTLEARSTELAVQLARNGATFVVVGSTARRLLDRGAPRPRDLDVVVAPAGVPALAAALRLLGATVDDVTLARGNPTRVTTGWCPVDVFVAPRPGGAVGVALGGTTLLAHGGVA